MRAGFQGKALVQEQPKYKEMSTVQKKSRVPSGE